MAPGLRRIVLVVHVTSGAMWFGLLTSTVIESPSTRIIWVLAGSAAVSFVSGTALGAGPRLRRYRWVRAKGAISVAVIAAGTMCIALPLPVDTVTTLRSAGVLALIVVIGLSVLRPGGRIPISRGRHRPETIGANR